MTAEDFLEIAAAISDPLCLLTLQGQILAANPAACKFLGLDTKLPVKQALQDLLTPASAKKLRQHLRSWSASRQPLPAALTLQHDNDETDIYCQGNLLRPRSAEGPGLIMMRCRAKASVTGNFTALNDKIARLEKQIIENRRFENALQESEARVRLLLESTGEAIYGTDLDGCCNFVNPACLHILGYDKSEQLLGKERHELIHHSHADGNHYPIETCPIHQAHITGQYASADGEVFWRKDGSAVPVEYFAHPVRRDGKVVGSVVTFQNITERKEIEAQLARSQETLELAQAIAHIGSWDWNIVDNDLHWSDEIYRIFGLQAQAFGATYEAFLEHVHEDDRAAVMQAVNATVANLDTPYNIEHRMVRSDGSIRIVNERGKVYRDAAGRPLRMIGSVQDITEQKRAEEKIRKLNEELESRVEQRTAELRQANQQLERSLQQLHDAQEQLVQSEKMASLGGLVAGIAHEINTPVGVGVTAVTHLQLKIEDYAARYHNGKLTRDDFETLLKSATESGKIIHNNLERAAELIRSFKQVAVDRTTNELRSFDIREYLAEILQSLTPNLKQGAHTVSVNCPESIQLYSHPGALSQVITNLVMNSLIHGFGEKPSGKIRIAVTQNPDGSIELVYSDNGKGIPAEHVQRIFEPFFTTRRGRGGSGLGMHIVYNLVTQSLGGRIQCNSVEGKGAAFSILLPPAAGGQVDASVQGLG